MVGISLIKSIRLFVIYLETLLLKEMILLEHRVANEQEKNWKEADRFKAERHLRDNPESKEAHPFSLLPFGFGPRMCIGKRLADQELYLGLLKVR